jgi:hypothetical protein
VRSLSSAPGMGAEWEVEVLQGALTEGIPSQKTRATP